MLAAWRRLVGRWRRRGSLEGRHIEREGLVSTEDIGTGVCLDKAEQLGHQRLSKRARCMRRWWRGRRSKSL